MKCMQTVSYEKNIDVVSFQSYSHKPMVYRVGRLEAKKANAGALGLGSSRRTRDSSGVWLRRSKVRAAWVCSQFLCTRHNFLFLSSSTSG